METIFSEYKARVSLDHISTKVMRHQPGIDWLIN